MTNLILSTYLNNEVSLEEDTIPLRYLYFWVFQLHRVSFLWPIQLPMSLKLITIVLLFYSNFNIIELSSLTDRTSTSKSFKFSVNNFSIFIDFNLEFHHISTCRRTNESSSNCSFLLVKWSDISGIFIMFQNLKEGKLKIEIFNIVKFLHFHDKERLEHFEFFVTWIIVKHHALPLLN